VATPGKVDFIAVSPSWYHCFSIEDAIVASLNSVNAKFISQRCELGLLVGCDVTNVGRSSNSQFWPIIGKLRLDGTEPFDIELIKVTQSFIMSTFISHISVTEC
jgi:hypothetical protein